MHIHNPVNGVSMEDQTTARYAMHIPTATRSAAAMAISARPSIKRPPTVRTGNLPFEEEPEDWPPLLRIMSALSARHGISG